MKYIQSLLAAAALIAVAASCQKEMAPVIPDENEVYGDCYIGSLKVFTYDPVQGTRLYIGDVDHDKGTCTVFLPSYTMGEKTIPVIAVTAVTMTETGDKTTFRHGKFEEDIDGTVYRFPDGISGEAVRNEEGSMSLTMDYDIKPGKMPFALNHHFSGRCTAPLEGN